MPKADVYKVENNITLEFSSIGKQFRMYLQIENGLIILDEIKGKDVVNSQITFLGNCEPYSGEIRVERIQEVVQTEPPLKSPPSDLSLNKKKKKKKK